MYHAWPWYFKLKIVPFMLCYRLLQHTMMHYCFFYPIAFLCQTGMNDITNGFIILFISDNHYYVIVGVALMSCAEWRQRVYGFWLLVRCRWEWVSNLYHNDTNNIYIYIHSLTHTYTYVHIHLCILSQCMLLYRYIPTYPIICEILTGSYMWAN